MPRKGHRRNRIHVVEIFPENIADRVYRSTSYRIILYHLCCGVFGLRKSVLIGADGCFCFLVTSILYEYEVSFTPEVIILLLQRASRLCTNSSCKGIHIHDISVSTYQKHQHHRRITYSSTAVTRALCLSFSSPSRRVSRSCARSKSFVLFNSTLRLFSRFTM